MRPIAALALTAVLVAVTSGCGGSSGDTTVINNTTTVTEVAEQSTSTAAETGAGPVKREEYSGPCEPDFAVPEGAGAGYENLSTLLAECEYAKTVADAWSLDYGRECYQGCTKTIEGIPCDYDGSEVVCSAAQTEVRWDIVYLEPS